MSRQKQFTHEHARQERFWLRRGLTPQEAHSAAWAAVDAAALEYQQDTQGLGDADASILAMAHQQLAHYRELVAERITEDGKADAAVQAGGSQ